MRKSDLIYFGIIFILLGVVFYGVKFMKSETAQCLRNPYIYGAKQMGNVQCSCYQFNSGSCPATFFFNDTTFKADVNYCGNSNTNLFVTP